MVTHTCATNCFLAEETEIAIIEIERVTKRVIVEAEPLLLLELIKRPALDLSFDLSSDPPKELCQSLLSTDQNHVVIKTQLHHHSRTEPHCYELFQTQNHRERKRN